MKIGLTFTAKGGWDGAFHGSGRKRQGQSGGGTAVMTVEELLAADDSEEEFDSPATIEALADVLRDFGHDVELLGDGESLIRRLLDGARPDLVFNIAEGRGIGRTREARVPAILETFGIPYTGSDPLCLAVSLDKDCAKRLIQQAGVATPRWRLLQSPDQNILDEVRQFNWPLIVKPAYEGSSKGIRFTSLVRDEREFRQVVAEMRNLYQQPLLVEEYIEGDELTVGLIGNPPQVLGIMRILPTDTSKPFLYSLEVKRDWEERIQYECPARLSPAATQAVEHSAIHAFQSLGCRDFARVDFRLRGDVPYFLEANPLPGLSPTSGDIVFMARFLGITHPELMDRILSTARERIERTG